jgi:large subunit ribosomal protein L10
MSKTKQQKQETVKLLEDSLKLAKAVVFANFQGLKVSEAEELRRECRKNDIKMIAAKKTLVKRVCENLGLKDVNPKIFTGGVATFMAFSDEVAAAKVVNAFAKTHEALKIFGGVLEGKFTDVSAVKSLADLPGKQELLARLVGSINAPVSGFVNVLAGNLRGLASVLNNIASAKA